MTLDTPELLAARILIVDDQHANILLLKTALADAGYTQVSATANPREVCSLHWKQNFDLILLDLQMPGMDGFEVMEGLRQIDPTGYLPVLVVTAQPGQKLRALQAGARDFVSKPFDRVEILTRIRNFLEMRLLYLRVENDNTRLDQLVLERTTELRESEARFRSLVELASDWYWEQDEHGKFTRVSGPALEMLGLDEVAGDGDVNSQWNARERALLDEKVAARRPFLDMVYSRIGADGSERLLQTSGEPTFDPSGRFTGYRGVGTDVTERMRPSGDGRGGNELHEFRSGMDARSHAIFLLDRSNMRFVDVNDAACVLTGYSRDDLLASGPRWLCPAADDGGEPDPDSLIAGSGDFASGPLRLRRKDGGELLVEVNRHASRSEPGWMLVEVVRDLTVTS